MRLISTLSSVCFLRLGGVLDSDGLVLLRRVSSGEHIVDQESQCAEAQYCH